MLYVTMHGCSANQLEFLVLVCDAGGVCEELVRLSHIPGPAP